MLKKPKRIIVCEKDENRIRFIQEHYPDVLTVSPEACEDFTFKRTASMEERMLSLKLRARKLLFAWPGNVQDQMRS